MGPAVSISPTASANFNVIGIPQASKVSVEIDGRTGGAGLDRTRVPRSAPRVSGCGLGNTSRRTGRTALDGLRFHQPGLRHPTFLLLASWRTPHRYQVGGFGAAAADASGAQGWPAGVEIPELLQPAGGLRFRLGETQGPQAARLSVGAEKEDPAGVREDRYQRCGLAYFPAYGGNNAGGDGTTPAHHPRLLAAQQPACHQQVPAGDVKGQALGAGQVGRRHLANGLVAGAKADSMQGM